MCLRTRTQRKRRKLLKTDWVESKMGRKVSDVIFSLLGHFSSCYFVVIGFFFLFAFVFLGANY